MTTIAFRAMQFAREVHKDQRRKYTNEPYAVHLAEVAGIVAAAYDHGPAWYGVPLEHAVAVAWLHDSHEDQDISIDEILRKFCWNVASGVRFLSDTETGNRAERKAASRARLANAPGWVQSIKCADLVSNTQSIVMHDPKFAVTYFEEKRLLLDVLKQADQKLLAMAREIIQ